MQKFAKHITKILVCILLVFVGSTVYGQQKTKEQIKLEKQKTRLSSEIKKINEQLKKNNADQKENIHTLNLIGKKIKTRKKLIKSIQSNIFYLKNTINQNKIDIDSLTNEVTRLKKDYAEMVYYAYKTKSNYNKLMYVFSAESFNQAYKRLKYIQQFSEFRKKQVREIQSVQQTIKDKNIELTGNIESKKVLLNDEEVEKVKIEKEKESQQTLVQKLSKDQKQLEKNLKKKVKEQEKLTNEIKKIIAEQIRIAREKAKRRADSIRKAREKAGEKPTYIPETPFDEKLSADFVSNRGKLPWPVERGVITLGYGPYRHPILNKVELYNDGVDISTVKGAEAQAVFNGEVSAVISMPGGVGKAVLIRHGEYITVYSNLAEAYVKMGQKVITKQVIGKVLTDTEEGKTILKFQIWKGMIKLNPSYWLNKA